MRVYSRLFQHVTASTLLAHVTTLPCSNCLTYTIHLPSDRPHVRVCEFIFFFFFQAEDGIRDHCVTGVQTCALPISSGFRDDSPGQLALNPEGVLIRPRHRDLAAVITHAVSDVRPQTQRRAGHRQKRSEERRVGKECRSRWSPYH